MYKISDCVVYKKDVCFIKNIKERNGTEYYELEPIDDNSLTISLPIEDKGGFIHTIMNKKEVEKLIKKIPTIPVIEVNDKLIELEYEKLLSTGNKEDIVKVIKTTYQRNKDRLDNKKKLSDKDSNYFQKAERLLYNEFSVVLEMTFDEVKKYLYNEITQMVN